MSYFFYATYPPCPILSHFAWPPQPPLKSDIIYVRSLALSRSFATQAILEAVKVAE